MVHLVRAQIADAIVAHAEPTTHAELIRLLARPGYALHPQSRCRAGLFALEVCRAVRGSFDRTALLVAAAVELQLQSGHLFDDLQDRFRGLPDAADLAPVVALRSAATGTAAEASGDSPDPLGALRHFRDATGGASDGTLRMTRPKSGRLGAFAAGFAARIAGAEPDNATLFERLGFNLFTFAQLADDHRDARTMDFAAILALASLGRAHADLRLLSDRGHAMAALAHFLERLEAEARSIPGAVGPAVVA